MRSVFDSELRKWYMMRVTLNVWCYLSKLWLVEESFLCGCGLFIMGSWKCEEYRQRVLFCTSEEKFGEDFC